MTTTQLICKIFLITFLAGCTFKAVEDRDVLKNGDESQKHESIDIELQKSRLE